MSLSDILVDLGAIGLVILIIFVLLLPIISSIVVGISLATILGFTGITWWCFLYLFVMICIGLTSLYVNKG